MRSFLPSSYARSARVLGWSPNLVVTVLGALLLLDFVLMGVMFAAPTTGVHGGP